MKTSKCRRCGTCCVKGGPVLHGDDRHLLSKNILRPAQLVVIRKGEPAYNPASDRVEPAACEMLKIQGKAGSWECLFYDGAAKGCTIHNNRPLECRLLQCRDTSAVLAVTGKDCLGRRDIIKDTDPALPYLAAFAECSWERLNALLTTVSDQTIQAATEMLAADLALREEAVSRLKLSLAQELFYFGRPMFQAWHHAEVGLSFQDGLPRLQRRS